MLWPKSRWLSNISWRGVKNGKNYYKNSSSSFRRVNYHLPFDKKTHLTCETNFENVWQRLFKTTAIKSNQIRRRTHVWRGSKSFRTTWDKPGVKLKRLSRFLKKMVLKSIACLYTFLNIWFGPICMIPRQFPADL